MFRLAPVPRGLLAGTVSRILRGVLAAVLLTTACLALPLGTVSLWGRFQLADQERYVDTMAPLAGNPAVRTAVSDAVARAVNEEVDAGPLQDAVDSYVHQAVRSFSTTEAYRNAWDAANRAAHKAVLQALRGEEGGEVTIELAPLVRQLKAQLEADGVPFADNIPVRENRVTVLRADDLAQVRALTNFLEAVGVWLPLASLVLAAGGIALAPRRAVAVAGTGLGIALGAAAVQIMTGTGRRMTLGELPPDVPRDAVGAVYDALTSSLRTANWCLLAFGLLLALGAAGYGYRAARRSRVRDAEETGAGS